MFSPLLTKFTWSGYLSHFGVMHKQSPLRAGRVVYMGLQQHSLMIARMSRWIGLELGRLRRHKQYQCKSYVLPAPPSPSWNYIHHIAVERVEVLQVNRCPCPTGCQTREKSRYYCKLLETFVEVLQALLYLTELIVEVVHGEINVPAINFIFRDGKTMKRSQATRINANWNSPNTLNSQTAWAPGIKAVVCNCNRLCAGNSVPNWLQRESTESVVRVVAARYRCEVTETDPPPTDCCCLYCHVGRFTSCYPWTTCAPPL